MKHNEFFFWVTVSSGILVMVFILLPLIEMMKAPSLIMLKEAIQDKDVKQSICLSIYTAGLAGLISFVFGTPLAYLLARRNFRGKRLIEGIIDLPIVIPHPVAGIAILSVAGKNHWLENVSRSLGASMAGTFFALPFRLHGGSMVIGIIMCSARAISEFGAVVVIAYHPMIAPVMIYERFEAYGLKYSQPVAVWLVCICLVLFLIIGILTMRPRKEV